jgi:hypothetical protein
MGMGEDDRKPEHDLICSEAFWLSWSVVRCRGTVWRAVSCSQAQAQTDPMANELLNKMPGWLKSLWDMENELRSAARNGLILRTDEASAHLAKARQHLEEVMNGEKGIEPASGPETPLRKEGEI